MPEPNLPPLIVNLKTKEDHQDIISVPLIQENLPELPEQSRQNLIQEYNLKPDIAIQLVNESVLLDFFHELVREKSRNPSKVANVLINELLTVLNSEKMDLENCPITVTQLAEVCDLLQKKQINLDVSREIFHTILQSNDAQISVLNLIKEKGWSLITDENEIDKLCLEVIENNPKLVQLYTAGKVKVLRAMLGLLVKNTQNKLDMSVASKRLEDLLKNGKYKK